MPAIDGPEAPLPGERTWEGEHAAGLRWLLLGAVGLSGTYDDDTPLGTCVEIEGLFVDLPPRPREFVLLGGGRAHYGICVDVTGVFRDQAAPPVPQVRPLGCRPAPALLTALDAIGQTTKAAERRRRVHAEVHVVAADGSAGRLVGAAVIGA